MKVYVYVHVSADLEVLEAFQNTLDPALRGEVRFTKRVGRRGKPERGRPYWKSPEVTPEDDREGVAKLHELLQALRVPLLGLRGKNARIFAQLVSYPKRPDQVHGLYLPPEMIAVMHEVGAELDFDTYYYGVFSTPVSYLTGLLYRLGWKKGLAR